MDEENEKSFKESVLERISSDAKRVPITFPKEVFEVFDEFSKSKANHCYWLAVKLLLEEYRKQEIMDSKTLMLVERDNQLAAEISKIYKLIEDLNESSTPKEVVKERKHFGLKEGEKHEE